MFGKLVKYVVAKGMKILPNFIGRTSETAQSDLVSEGFVVGNVIESLSGEPEQQPYTGQVVDQNPPAAIIADYETPVDLTIRTFSFAPFGVFGFSPFSVFSFTPFSVFSFTPFKVFSFTPFNVFAFTPFKVFAFTPFKVFGFSPAVPVCIDEDTKVLTKNGYKKAKEIKNSDILITAVFNEMPIATNKTLSNWSSKTITGLSTIESKIKHIEITPVHETIIINNDINKRFSLQEDFLILRDNDYIFTSSQNILVGDYLVEYKNNKQEIILINNIETIKEKRNVYDFYRHKFGIIIAESVLVYNAYPIN
jgi:hypothetical protein